MRSENITRYIENSIDFENIKSKNGTGEGKVISNNKFVNNL